ncbi:MAG: tryptophan--tRNA ligase [Thermodesulfobacteriota bacterium]|nr:tryptophan--tRNA ligase [Thermodesulfobacteriota bacterium]
MDKKRILSGMRPTGVLHLGNLHGALQQWVKLQDEYDCFFFVADWHALTTNYETPGGLSESTREMVIDWLAAGLSPEKSTLFIQSHVKEHAELFLILSMLTPLPWLERNPTYKDQMAQLSGKDIATFGFLGYPVLQAADIIMYKANVVPVGEDQVPHVEITREIARRFNHLYGNVFPEPQTMLTKTARILGLDRRKMSKSYDNAIFMADSPEKTAERVAQMITDPQRARKSDPGDPDVCNVYTFHNLYTDTDTVAEINEGCRTASLGCVECKKRLAKGLNEGLADLREKRAYYADRPEHVDEIMKVGTDKARNVAEATMAEVRTAIKI